MEQKIVIMYTEDEVREISQQSLDEGRGLGFDEGYLRGKEEAITEHELSVQSLLIKMEQKMEEILENQDVYLEKLGFNSKTLFFAFAKKILPHYVQKYGLFEMENFIKDLLNHLLHKEKIIVNVHPDFKESLEKQFHSNECKADCLIFNSDERLNEQQIDVQWNNGGATYDIDQVYKIVDKVFDPKGEESSLLQNS